MVRSPWISDLHWVRTGRQSRSRKTQESLLDAAEEIFFLKGADATSVADVAARAGCSVGAVYHHFRDKKALLYALFDRVTEDFRATTRAALDPARWEGASIADILKGYLDFALETVRARPGFQRLGLEVTRRDPTLGERFSNARTELERGLTGLLLARRAEIGHPEPELAVAFVLDQLGSMLNTRKDGVPVRSQLGGRSDETFVHEALRSACAYLKIAPVASSRTATATAELRRLLEANVREEEIDHLGHMNVRFYLEKALRASQRLAAEHGLGAEDCRALGAVLELRDVFTRHYREQLVGAPLAVLGGVLSVRADGLRVYHELLNVDRDERAATFVHELTLRQRETREPLPLPENVANRAADALVEWPEHGKPRTLDLQRFPPTLPLEEARQRNLAMRQERVIRREECDGDGFFVAAGYDDLVWGGDPIAQQPAWVPVVEMENGGMFGWATLESRGVLLELPRAGDRIQSFGADVELARKTSCRHQWVFDLDRGALLCTSSIVNLGFDIGARLAIEIPAPIREMLEAQYHPDLR